MCSKMCVFMLLLCLQAAEASVIDERPDLQPAAKCRGKTSVCTHMFPSSLSFSFPSSSFFLKLEVCDPAVCYGLCTQCCSNICCSSLYMYDLSKRRMHEQYRLKFKNCIKSNIASQYTISIIRNSVHSM